MKTNAIFSTDWGDRLVSAWNQHTEYHRKMAGAGTVKFVVLNQIPQKSIELNWNENGIMARLTNKESASLPTFSATEDEWNAFINGEYSAVAGVMSGRIIYKGKMSFAFRYGASFDFVSKVARKL